MTKELQKALNDSYKSNLAVDGSYGPKTKAVVKEHPLSIKKQNDKLEHTKWLQKALKEAGYDLAGYVYFSASLFSHNCVVLNDCKRFLHVRSGLDEASLQLQSVEIHHIIFHPTLYCTSLEHYTRTMSFAL